MTAFPPAGSPKKENPATHESDAWPPDAGVSKISNARPGIGGDSAARSKGTARVESAGASTQPSIGGGVQMPERLGQYRIVRKLGQGGMAAVYLAENTNLDRLVAVKVPLTDVRRSPELLARFLREGRAAAKVVHPHICQVYVADEADGLPYIAMEYIDGAPLSKVIATRPLNDVEAATVVRKVALALQAAHEQNLIHRDIKPSNIILTKSGEPKVTDFGLAKTLNSNNSRNTATGAFLGTPAYVSREQALGEAPTPAMDIYSLGVTLFELLTRRLPFEGPTDVAVLGQVLTADPPSPSTHRHDLDRQLSVICLKALTKEPARRHASMAEFAAELFDWLQRPPNGVQLAEQRPTSEGAASVGPKLLPAFARNRWLWLAGIAVTAAVTLLVLTVVGNRSRTGGVTENKPDLQANSLNDSPVGAIAPLTSAHGPDGKSTPNTGEALPTVQRDYRRRIWSLAIRSPYVYAFSWEDVSPNSGMLLVFKLPADLPQVSSPRAVALLVHGGFDEPSIPGPNDLPKIGPVHTLTPRSTETGWGPGSRLAVIGRYLYIATGQSIEVYGFDDLGRPEHVTSVDLPGVSSYACAFVCALPTLYLCTSVSLHIFDIADPRKPVWVEKVPADGELLSGCMVGTHFYAGVRRSNRLTGAGFEGIHIFDVTEPTNARRVASIETWKSPHQCLVADNDRLIALMNERAQLYHIGDRERPVPVGPPLWITCGTGGTLAAADRPYLILEGNVVELTDEGFGMLSTLPRVQFKRGMLPNYGACTADDIAIAPSWGGSIVVKLPRPPTVPDLQPSTSNRGLWAIGAKDIQ